MNVANVSGGNGGHRHEAVLPLSHQRDTLVQREQLAHFVKQTKLHRQHLA